MIKFSLELVSKFQILLGINYHSGTEVFDTEIGEDLKLDYHEIQLGLIFILVGVTFYTPHNTERED